MEKEATPRPDQDSLLIEYQKAQDSAEHHTNLGWTVTSILCAGNLVLLCLIVGTITDEDFVPLLGIVIALLGIILSITINLSDCKLAKVAKQKYDRCKEIEKILNLEQHQNYSPPSPSLRMLFNIVTFSLIVTWIVVLGVIVF